jgi:hypothetical protein
MAKRKQQPRFAKPARKREGAAIEMPSAPALAKRKTRADIERELSGAYQSVFSSPQGEIVKADLMLCGNVYHEISGSDLFSLGVKEGERRIALRIAKYLGLRPEHFATEAWAMTDSINALAGSQ